MLPSITIMLFTHKAEPGIMHPIVIALFRLSDPSSHQQVIRSQRKQAAQLDLCWTVGCVFLHCMLESLITLLFWKNTCLCVCESEGEQKVGPKSHQGAELLITDSCILIFYLIIYNEEVSLIGTVLLIKMIFQSAKGNFWVIVMICYLTCRPEWD